MGSKERVEKKATSSQGSAAEIASIAERVSRSLGNYKYADAVIAQTKYTSISLKDGEVESAREGNTESISCRILQGGSFGFSSSNMLMDWRKVLGEAARLARIKGGKIRLAEPEANMAKIGTPAKDKSANHDFEQKIRMLKGTEKIAKTGKVKNTSLVYYDSDSMVFTLNSSGAWIEENDVRTGAACHVYAKQAGRIESSFEQVKEKGGYEILKGFPAKVKKAAQEANSLLKARHGPHGRMIAILDPELAGVLSHEAVGHACEADGIMNKSSCLRGLLGKRIGSPQVTIMDSPIVSPKLWGSYQFDDEATKAKGTTLVEKGVLKGYLTSLENASEYRNILTGNGRGDSHFRQIVRMSNTYFDKGECRPEELFEGVRDGVYLVGCKEGQVSPKVGNFTFAAKYGFIIKNGKKKHMVRDCSINGNILQSLNHIDMVANDLEFLPGTCGKDAQSAPVTTGSPHLRIREILVG